MTLVAKSNHFKVLKSSEKGQISIFFSASLVVLISIIAFVINVGLFVKAKINLQNATDAAAFAGAAVQARQLTKIAHLNWEMRNIYKEWMYKYYVLGNLNIDDVINTNGGSGPMSFAMQEDRDVLNNEVRQDIYNFPSVCINLSTENLCRRYAIPGLPEFGSSNLPGAEQASRAFQDNLIASKSYDCIRRTRVNMMTTAMWAYNVLSNQNAFEEEAPAILAHRPGAFPIALELAMRIRNLEKITNREPLEKVCIQQGASTKIQCQHSIDQISSEPKANERIVKAFYSGFRNIGGSSEDDDEMKGTFTLTELSPNVLTNDSPSDPSNLLIPSPYYKKVYLDLKLMSINYAVFYSAMIPRAQNDTSGACDISKAAIPIPGYPLGFYKNPDYLTYYAVKGEAEFIGMFNPFGGETVVMTAYAAAKPMGGRIGPMLFTDKASGADILTIGRPGTKKRSVPYIVTLNMVGSQILLPDTDLKKYVMKTAQAGDFGPGVALPVNGGTPPTNFWLTDADKPVGGRITDSSGVQFGIPNLVYDYETPFQDDGYSTDADEPLHIIELGSAPNSTKAVGLFSKTQFSKFKGSLGTGTVGAEEIEAQIYRVRAPTSYEAANYLIPIPFEMTKNSSLGHYGQIPGSEESLNGIKIYRSYVYAPLFGNHPDDLLYGQAKLFSTIRDYLLAQESGVKKYIGAMNKVAATIYSQKDMLSESAAGAAAGFEKAASGISDITFTTPSNIANQIPQTCDSLLGSFLQFYYGGDVGIPTSLLNGQMPPGGTNCSKSFGDLLRDYYTTTAGATHYKPDYYFFELSWDPNGGLDLNRSQSAYVPGPFTGVAMDGIYTNFTGVNPPENMRRNFYSTKLVKLKSLVSNGIYDQPSTFPTMSEGDVQGNSDIQQKSFKNPLVLPPEANDIDH